MNTKGMSPRSFTMFITRRHNDNISSIYRLESN